MKETVDGSLGFQGEHGAHHAEILRHASLHGHDQTEELWQEWGGQREKHRLDRKVAI